MLFGNEGADTLERDGGTPTLIGGNDFADGNDSLFCGRATAAVWSSGTAATTRFVPAATRRQHRRRRLRQRLRLDASGAERSRLRQRGQRHPESWTRGATPCSAGWATIACSATVDARRSRATKATTRSAAMHVGGSIDTISGGTGNDVFVYGDAGGRRRQRRRRRAGRVHHRRGLVGRPVPDGDRRSPSPPTAAPAPGPTSTRPPTMPSPRPSPSTAAATRWRRSSPSAAAPIWRSTWPPPDIPRRRRPAARHHRGDRDRSAAAISSRECRARGGRDHIPPTRIRYR